MKRFVLFASLALLLGCNAAKQVGQQPPQQQQSSTQLSGPWEFVAISQTTPNFYTYVETNLTAGSASGLQQIGWLDVEFTQAPNWLAGFGAAVSGVGAYCGDYTAPGSLSTTVTGSSLSFTLNRNGSQYTGTGTLNSDGSVSGTYSSVSGAACPDHGTFTGKEAVNFAGNYTGSCCVLSLAQTGTTVTLSLPPDTSAFQTGYSVGNAGVLNPPSGPTGFALSSFLYVKDLRGDGSNEQGIIAAENDYAAYIFTQCAPGAACQ